MLNNGNLTLSVVNVGIIVQSTIPLPAGWCHVVATKNGATSKLYINGSDVTGTVSNITCGTPGDDVSIGSATSAGVEFWNGSIGQAAVYNYALTPSQVAKHYALGASAYSDVVIGDAPIGYWKLGDPPVLPTATIVFACGGDATTEPNVASHWSTTAGTVTKDTTHVRSGTSALKMTGSDFGKVTHTLTAGKRVLVARFSVWVPSIPVAGSTILQWNDGVATRQLFIDPDTFIYMDFGISERRSRSTSG